jgi:hypothetical protein
MKMLYIVFAIKCNPGCNRKHKAYDRNGSIHSVESIDPRFSLSVIVSLQVDRHFLHPGISLRYKLALFLIEVAFLSTIGTTVVNQVVPQGVFLRIRSEHTDSTGAT